MKRIWTVALGDPLQLGAFLLARRGESAALIAAGNVRVDGERCDDPDRTLQVGARIILFETAVEVGAVDWILRDEWIAVVNKPAGLPSQATPQTAHALDLLVTKEIPDARLLHRLDRDASGLVLFAKERATAILQDQLTQGAIERHYVAVVAGDLAGEGTISLRIARHPQDERRRQALPENAPGGEPASTRYRSRLHGAQSSIVELELGTGRTHQIRVHLAAIGHPILGDRLYDGPAAERLLLHAHRLKFAHPANGRPLDFQARAPFLTLGSA